MIIIILIMYDNDNNIMYVMCNMKYVYMININICNM